MTTRHLVARLRLVFLSAFVALLGFTSEAAENAKERRMLYVATPGIRNYLEYGGHGLLVYDIDQGHKFIKRIPTAGLDENDKPRNVKGICVSVPLKRVFISTPKTMMAVDLMSEKVLWEKPYEGGCDRMAISPDGSTGRCPSTSASASPARIPMR